MRCDLGWGKGWIGRVRLNVSNDRSAKFLTRAVCKEVGVYHRPRTTAVEHVPSHLPKGRVFFDRRGNCLYDRFARS